MSIIREAIFAAQPTTVRAQTTHLSYDTKSDRIAYASGKSIFIRSVANPEKSVQFSNHQYNTTVAKFAPSGFYIASGDEAGNVKIWDTSNEEELIVKGEYHIFNGRINDIQWDADSKRIITVGNGKERYGHAFTWDSGNTVGEISGHSAQINAVSIKPNRPYRAATVSDDSALVVYNGPPFKFDSSVRGHHTGFIKDVKYSPNGEFLVSVGADRQIVFYDGKTCQFVKKIKNNHEGGIFSISFIDDDQFVTSSADATVKLWSIKDEKLIKTWAFEKKVENQQLGVIAAGKLIISLSFSGDLNYLSLDSNKPIKVIKGHQKSITTSVFDSKNLYTGSYDGKIFKWDLLTGKAFEELGHANLVVGLATDKEDIYSVAWDDKIQSLYSKSSESLPAQPKGISSNDNIVAVITEDVLLGYSMGKKQFSTKLEQAATAIGTSNKYIIVGFQNLSISVYNSLGVKEFNLPPTRSIPSYISFSSNGKFVAIGDSSGKINLYNLETKKIQTSRWVFHTSRITSISWNKDNNYVVSGSLDTNIIVYQVKVPGKNIKFLGAHKEGVTTVQWTSNDEIFSSGNDATIKKWKVIF